MIRKNIVPRQNWQAEVESLGLIWHTADGQPYWNESAYYQFSPTQIGVLEKASIAVYELFLEAGDYVLNNNLLGQFGIPEYCHNAIKMAWENEPPAINYGRFDFGYDGVSAPKLFEFNCDTPTSLLEAAVVQWYWKEQQFPDADQFNSIHEALIDRWTEIAPLLGGRTIHFTHINDDVGEDTVTATYMRDLAAAAGLKTEGILINDIGWDGSNFKDLAGKNIDVCQHLYPWEWMMNEEFGKNIVNTIHHTTWIEPIWKMIWSNKAILPVLTMIAPDHPNLLESYFNAEPFHRGKGNRGRNFVKKPILAREGANIEIHDGASVVSSIDQGYGEEGFIYQELYKLPNNDGNYPVIGSWMVDGAPVGMGIREDGLITGNTARFIPHIVVS